MTDSLSEIVLPVSEDQQFRAYRNRVEERIVLSLIADFQLDPEQIRLANADSLDETRLCLSGFRSAHPCCPVELTFQLFQVEHEQCLFYMSSAYRPRRTVEYREYCATRSEYWSRYPHLRERPFGMIFKLENLDTFVLHDLTFSNLQIQDSMRSCLEVRSPYWKAWSHPYIYMHTWPTFRSMLRQLWGSQRTSIAVDPAYDDESAKSNDFLKAEMKAIGLRQRHLAEALQVSEAFISMCFSGRRRWPNGKIDQALAWLRDRANDEFPEVQPEC